MTPMDAFEACARCACYVKTLDEACPFCGAARTERGPARRRAAARMSRAAWLATTTVVSALAFAGCSAATDTPSSEKQATVDGDGGGQGMQGTSSGEPGSDAAVASQDDASVPDTGVDSG